MYTESLHDICCVCRIMTEYKEDIKLQLQNALEWALKTRDQTRRQTLKLEARYVESMKNLHMNSILCHLKGLVNCCISTWLRTSLLPNPGELTNLQNSSSRIPIIPNSSTLSE